MKLYREASEDLLKIKIIHEWLTSQQQQLSTTTVWYASNKLTDNLGIPSKGKWEQNTLERCGIFGNRQLM